MGTIGYLGPEGTFTNAAAKAFAAGTDELLPISTATGVVQAVESGEVDAGVIALENSLEGVVTKSLDELIKETQTCLIAGEKVLRVSFSLFAPKGDDPLVGVRSHPFALAQCSDFIEEHGLATAETNSTAEACKMVAHEPEKGWGAIGPTIAGETYGLQPLRTELENEPGPQTRFILLKRSCPPSSGRDHSAFSLMPQKDEPGSLVRILLEFSARRINLTAIKSRPSQNGLGEYVFFIECEGHISDALLRSAVLDLLRQPNHLRFMGSFPVDHRARPPSSTVPSSTADQQYAEMITHVESK